MTNATLCLDLWLRSTEQHEGMILWQITAQTLSAERLTNEPLSWPQLSQMARLA